MKSAFSEPEIVAKNARPVSVILPNKVYQEMLELLEDAEDFACLTKGPTKDSALSSTGNGSPS